MGRNAFLDELEKVANDLIDEPMNPDMQPEVTDDEVADTQVENEDQAQALHQEAAGQEELQFSESEVTEAVMEQAIEEEAAAQGMLPEAQAPEQAQAPQADPSQVVQEAEQGIPQEEEELLAAMQQEEQVATDVCNALIEKAAEDLINLATIAKIAEYAAGGDYVPEELHKEATAIAEEMVQDGVTFNQSMERVASEIFAVEQNVKDLFTTEGIQYVFEQLAHLDAAGFDKQADMEGNPVTRLATFARDAIMNTKDKVMEAANSALHLKQISAELAQVTEEMKPVRDMYENYSPEAAALVTPEQLDNFKPQMEQYQDLVSKQKAGRVGLGAGFGLAAAGAAYGGKKLYDHNHREEEEEKVAGVLPDGFAGGTLDAVQENENTGGIREMSRELVNDFLKVAGAAGLISIVNDENQDMELRKEASEAFEQIANMGRSDMGEHLVKVATEVFSEQELHEIVAGHHTDFLIEKVAFFVDAVDASYDEVLEKTASAAGVAAVTKFGAGIRDHANNIIAAGAKGIDKAKEAAQGAGRGYVGVLKGHNGKGAQAGGIAATGLAGGGLVGAGAMAGYNALNNPGEYDIEQTAAAYEEAILAKQAAVEAFAAADQFTQQFSHLFAK